MGEVLVICRKYFDEHVFFCFNLTDEKRYLNIGLWQPWKAGQLEPAFGSYWVQTGDGVGDLWLEPYGFEVLVPKR